MLLFAAKQSPAAGEEESMLSFVPEGMTRSAVEYVASLLPGAVLLFAFFMAAEAAVLFVTGNEWVSFSFAPVICLMPIISGLVSTLILEKLRKKPLTFQRGALVGAGAGFAGAFLSAILLVLISLLTAYKQPFGSFVGAGPVTYVVLLAVVVVDTILGALGGVLVVKFIKDI